MKKLLFTITLLFFFFPLVVQAADNLEFNPQVKIPGMEDTYQKEKNEEGEVEYSKQVSGNTIGEYIKLIYNYALGVVGMLAVVVIAIGGVMWLTSGGNQTRISQAKSWISGALIGMLLLFVSFIILRTINPELVKFDSIQLGKQLASRKDYLKCCSDEGPIKKKEYYFKKEDGYYNKEGEKGECPTNSTKCLNPKTCMKNTTDKNSNYTAGKYKCIDKTNVCCECAKNCVDFGFGGNGVCATIASKDGMTKSGCESWCNNWVGKLAGWKVKLQPGDKYYAKENLIGTRDYTYCQKK